jgi:hypothetical protein
MSKLRCIGGPLDGHYIEEHPDHDQIFACPLGGEPDWTTETEAEQITAQTGVKVRHYHRTQLGWGYEGLTFERDALIWDGLDLPDALVILMRKFVDLLDSGQL